MATVAFTLQLLGGAPAGDDPLYFRSTNPAIRDGYVSEQRELWTADGRLVALNPQTLEPGEDLVVLEALRGVLMRVPAVAPIPNPA